MKKMLHVVLPFAVLLSACGPAATVMSVAAPTVSTMTLGDLTVSLTGAGGMLTWQQVIEDYPEIFADYPQLLADVSHAEARHGPGIVDLADQCLEKHGAVKTMYNQASQRTALVCQMDDGRFIVKIQDAANEVITTFIKEKMKTLEQVVHYLMNRGYLP